jgi:hypothetical protein
LGRVRVKERQLCACGCGQWANIGFRYIKKHFSRRKAAVINTCEFCKKQFVAKSGHTKKQRFCSTVCSAESYSLLPHRPIPTGERNKVIKWQKRKHLSGCCVRCGQINPRHPRTLCLRCKLRAKELRRQHQVRKKKAAFEAYGGSFCACCGETGLPFLALDHIHGDGKEEKMNGYRVGGERLYALLKKQGYPQGRYRVLCHNCNMGRYLNGGECPHARA